MKELKNQPPVVQRSLRTTRATCLLVLSVIGFKLQCPFSFSKTDFVVRPSTEDERAAFRDQVKSCFFPVYLFKGVSFSRLVIELSSNISGSLFPQTLEKRLAYRHCKLIMVD